MSFLLTVKIGVQKKKVAFKNNLFKIVTISFTKIKKEWNRRFLKTSYIDRMTEFNFGTIHFKIDKVKIFVSYLIFDPVHLFLMDVVGNNKHASVYCCIVAFCKSIWLNFLIATIFNIIVI